MKFKDLIDNPTLQNKIKFQKQKINNLEDDMKTNGEDGFGTKRRKLENLKKDLKKIENDYKRVNQ